MQKFFYILITIFWVASLYAEVEAIKCPPDTFLVDLVYSSTKERLQSCQKNINGKYIKEGPEILYHQDGSIKERKFYKSGEEFKPIDQNKDKKNIANISNSSDSIIAGMYSSCAVIKGAAKCWGRNPGAGNKLDQRAPINVFELNAGIQSISTSGTSTCALTINNDIKCWTDTTHISFLNSAIPIEEKNKYFPNLVAVFSEKIRVIATGYRTICALTENNELKCIDSAGNKIVLPEGVNNNVFKIAIAGSNNGDHFCAQKGAEIKCWGIFDWLTKNEKLIEVNIPTVVSELSSGVKDFSISDWQDCFVTFEGSVKCRGLKNIWSNKDFFHPDINLNPVIVIGLEAGVSAVSIGQKHGCALMNNGEVKCWGKNNEGQLGNCGDKDRSEAVTVKNLSNAVSISAGVEHTCAFLKSGEIKCWGSNVRGELGNDSTSKSSCSPVIVKGI